MWQLASTHYVYGVGVRPQPNTFLKAFLVMVGLLVTISGSSLGVLQVNRVVTAATEAVVPNLIKPINPKFDLAISQPPELETAHVTHAIENWIRQHPDNRWSVAIRGLGNDTREIEIGEGVYAPASLYKLLMVPALFDGRTLAQLETTKLSGGALKTCFDKMLLRSDNPCGEAIANNLVGWGMVDANLQSGGYHSLLLKDPNIMTVGPADMVKFMADFYEGKLTTPDVRDYVLSLLTHQQFRSGIPAGCNGCLVMNKTGDNSKGRHDVAIVKTGGHVYAVGIFSDGGSYAEIADLASVINKAFTK